jgi:hypothetical protein
MNVLHKKKNPLLRGLFLLIGQSISVCWQRAAVNAAFNRINFSLKFSDFDIGNGLAQSVIAPIAVKQAANMPAILAPISLCPIKVRQ